MPDSSFHTTQIYSPLSSSKLTTMTDLPPNLSSIFVEMSANEIALTNGKYSPASTCEKQHCYSVLSYSSNEITDETGNLTTMNKEQSETDLSEATDESNHLLYISHDRTKATKHVNPKAPDFKPIDFKSTYRSELVSADMQRKLNFRYNRPLLKRYYSDAHHNRESFTTINTSNIRPLFSIVSQYTPHYQHPWNITTPLLLSSPPVNPWCAHEYSNISNTTFLYCSSANYQFYPSLMQQQSLNHENQCLYQEKQNQHSSRQIRTHSSRPFVFSSQRSTSRKRSYSGPEVPLQLSSGHLEDIHSLTEIMVDILKMVNQRSDEQEQINELTSSLYSSTQHKYQKSSHSKDRQSLIEGAQYNATNDVRNALVDDNISTKAASIVLILSDRMTGIFLLIRFIY